MTTSTANPVRTQTIDAAISRVSAAIDAHVPTKGRAHELAMRVLGADNELPEKVEDLEAVLAELRELRIVTEYAELKAVIDASPAIVVKLNAEWLACPTALENTHREYYAAASESRLPHHEHWDARAIEFQKLLDAAHAALDAARSACTQEMTRVGESKVRCARLLREHGNLLIGDRG